MLWRATGLYVRSNRPSEHVSRTRRKLPGYHNRRYKGKSREIDRGRSALEGFRAARAALPFAVQGDLDDLIGRAPMELLWVTAQVLRDVGADATVLVGLADDVVCCEFDEGLLQIRFVNGRSEARLVLLGGSHPPPFRDLASLRKSIQKELGHYDEPSPRDATMT